MRLTAGVCLKVPNGLDHRRAALTEPMSVGRHAVARADVTPDEAAIVLGAGPVGLAVIAELRRIGRRVDRRQRLLAAPPRGCARHGCDPRGRSGGGVTDGRLAARGRPPSARCVFDAIGVPGTLGEAMRMAPAAGARVRRRLVHGARHDPAAAPADEAAHDRVLVRVRPVRVRRHVARRSPKARSTSRR